MEQSFKVNSVNISEIKGVRKNSVKYIDINEKGIENDAHSGDWHRQVSILGTESIEHFSKELSRTITPGEFAENITLDGFNFDMVKISDKLTCGEVELEVTQIGKKCHGTGCAIFKEAGNCVMPKEGIFCKVIYGGRIKSGDTIFKID